MLFTSKWFLVLVAVTMILFYLPLLRRFQTLVLIASSFVFYALNQLIYLPLLLISIGFNAWTSHAIYFHKDIRKARRRAILGVVVNVGILVFFKYAGLMGHLLPANWLADGPGHFLTTVLLPVGISFFTFEGISLVVDTYRARGAEDFFGTHFGQTRRGHLASTTLFISFFPHLVAGPILKAHDFYPQIKPKRFADINWQFCFEKMVLGYFLKMVVADGLKEMTFFIAYPYYKTVANGMDLFALLFGFSIQIFADFGGYSLIAIGVAGLFGYRLPENFEFPYISRSFSEFWRRWHISLSSWLREYLYFPMGGNRKGAFRTYFNLFVVMFLGGLWHGAAWSFAIWGSVHGLALAIERALGLPAKRAEPARKTAGTTIRHYCREAMKILLVFSVVTGSWLLFKLQEIGHAAEYVGQLFTRGWAFGYPPLTVNILILSAPVVLYHLAYLVRRPKTDQRDESLAFPDASASHWAIWTHQFLSAPRALWGHVTRWPEHGWFRYLAFGAMLFMLILNSSTSGEFIYFQF
jgi:alginate O-acetyltransferase complex protein AlgI